VDRDIRQSDLFQEAEAFYRQVRQPGSGLISDATDLHAAPDGKQAAFTGILAERLEGVLTTLICVTQLGSGETQIVTAGPNADRLPKYSPDGRYIAFLSDRHQAEDFQLHLLDTTNGSVRAVPRVAGWVEYLHWSHDGSRILLGVAGHGADRASGQGAVTSKQAGAAAASWMPAVESGEQSYRWRSVWIYELGSDAVRRVSEAGNNIWEAQWCGNDAIAAVMSSGPSEGLWYSARLCLIDLRSGRAREIYIPRNQLGWPSGSLSGRYLTVLEAVCSDRGIVAGDLHLIDITTGRRWCIDTLGVDVTCVEWRSDNHLMFAGQRGFESVIGSCDVQSGEVQQIWASSEISGSGRYISVSGCNGLRDCVFVTESYVRAPEIGVLSNGNYETVKSFGAESADDPLARISVERISWQAPDGLNIDGWLLLPETQVPHPLIMYVHGGPVWQWRPTWLGRSGAPVAMLLRRACAVFFPNPRGSAGRRQDFACRVIGDMGGADTRDYLSGLDHLVQRGIADPRRLGVIGVSYGGYMAAWLVTQDSRFAAAVASAPITNFVTEHLVSNIPHWVRMFLVDDYRNPQGKYYSRSPIMHAHKVRTPTLNICGALDRCTPPEEARQFHNALLENGVRSALVTYPEEGHGVRKYPTLFDYAARVVGWFEEHVIARSP
jgi:dipeptidyl aminopeptidase/acylaminoacyl peptidase